MAGVHPWVSAKLEPQAATRSLSAPPERSDLIKTVDALHPSITAQFEKNGLGSSPIARRRNAPDLRNRSGLRPGSGRVEQP